MTDRQDITSLGGQISNIVSRLRKNALKTTVGGISGGTSVTSSFGYQRWTGNGTDETTVSDNDHVTSAEEITPLNTAHDQDGEIVSSVDGSDATENGLSLDPELAKSLSSTSIDIPADPPTTKVDTITEWQAGWNVTNAIQVSNYQ